MKYVLSREKRKCSRNIATNQLVPRVTIRPKKPIIRHFSPCSLSRYRRQHLLRSLVLWLQIRNRHRRAIQKHFLTLYTLLLSCNKFNFKIETENEIILTILRALSISYWSYSTPAKIFNLYKTVSLIVDRPVKSPFGLCLYQSTQYSRIIA